MWLALNDQELKLVEERLRAACHDDGTSSAEENLLDRILEQAKADPRDAKFFAAAKEIHEEEGTLEIDSDPVVSYSDEGAYVMAWVWVSNEDAGIKYDDEERTMTMTATRYSHVYELQFVVESDNKDAEDVMLDMLRVAILKFVDDAGDLELVAACELVATHEMTGEV